MPKFWATARRQNPSESTHHKIVGALTQKQSGEVFFGPMVLYSIIHNSLKLIETQTGSFDREKIEFIQKVASGKEQASFPRAFGFSISQEYGLVTGVNQDCLLLRLPWLFGVRFQVSGFRNDEQRRWHLTPLSPTVAIYTPLLQRRVL